MKTISSNWKSNTEALLAGRGGGNCWPRKGKRYRKPLRHSASRDAIAKAAGVEKTTVAAYFSGMPISPATRTAIDLAIARLSSPQK